MKLSGRRVLVVGLGASGLSAARALAGLGAVVRVTEAGRSQQLEERARQLRAAGIEVELGGHDLSRLDCDLAVVSPGIPPHVPVVRELESRGVEIVGELEIAARLARCDLLAVTGTNGKTTTTSLLASILSGAGIETVAAGNIGLPLIDAVRQVGPGGAIAVEVSSFQLATAPTFAPRVAVLLNIAEDHTDWHGSFEDYVAAKARIFANQRPEDHALVNLEDPEVVRAAEAAPARLVGFSALRAPAGGIGFEGGWLLWRGRRVMARSEIPLAGRAGLEDVAAAAGAALVYGIPPEAVAAAVKRFRPLGHRLEVVGEIDGVTWIDDSKATNPHATLAAVAGLQDVVLIAGGRSKGIDLSPLARTVPPVRAVVAIGEAAAEVQRVFAGLVPVRPAGSMAEAVEAAAALATPGGSVLLSPGCASLDMYESYAHRGRDFTAAVRALADRAARCRRT